MCLEAAQANDASFASVTFSNHQKENGSMWEKCKHTAPPVSAPVSKTYGSTRQMGPVCPQEF